MMETKKKIGSFLPLPLSNRYRGGGWGRKKFSNFSKYQKNLKNSKTSNLVKIDFEKIMPKYGALQSTKTSRFVQLFLGYTNKKFQTYLALEMNYWKKFLANYKAAQIQKYGFFKYAPPGFEKKWSLNFISKFSSSKTRNLMKLVQLLQKQALVKLENLRKEFLVLGYLTKAKSFMYFQRIRFIKALRSYIFEKNTIRIESKEPNQQELKKQEKAILSLTEKALKRKFFCLFNEKQTKENKQVKKFQFIEYLQQSVKEHRKKNIFFYLPIQNDSLNYFKKIRIFNRQQASFLFGISSDLTTRHIVKNQILKTIRSAPYGEGRKNHIQKTFQEIFFEQLQKQKFMYKQNIQLTPKISFKFYKIKFQTLETTASFVANSIVDDLEKRKAFRRVLKKAKEDLMRSSKVKGVKIQVSGRLNGAEMARTEWVRSGRVPLQTLRANIDYSYKTAQTIYGIIGVKVWIYKGLVQ